MRQKRVNANDGFTLAEVMLATLIMGIVLSSVLAVASHCALYLGDIRRSARSSQVLQQEMESVRLLNWTQMAALPATFSDPNDTAGVYSGAIVQAAYDSYSGTTTVMTVTLFVTWTNRLQHVETNSLTTLVSNGGLNKYIF